MEIEFSEDDVVYYIVDEDENEIGVCLKEDGKEVEYMYVDHMKEAIDTFKDLKQAANEIKDIKKEIKDTFNIFGKK